MCVFNSPFLSLTCSLILTLIFPFIHSTFPVISPLPSPAKCYAITSTGSSLFPDHTQGPSCICLLQNEGLRADLPRKQCLGEAPFPVWPTVCISLCHQSGPFWNSCNHSTNMYLTLTTNPVHVAYLSLLCPLSLWPLRTSHSELTYEYNLATKCCPGTTLLHGPDSLFLRLRVSMCLSPFQQTFPEDILCAEPYAFFSLPTTQRFLHLSGYTCPILPVSVLCLLISLIFLFFSQSLSFSLPLCVYLFQGSFYFSHSLSISTSSCPPQVCLTLQAWSLPGHKSPSLQPYGSHYHSLSRICWPLPGPLTLRYASFSISFSLTVSVILSPKLILSLAVYTCYSQSLSLSLCLAYPLSISLLYYVK